MAKAFGAIFAELSGMVDAGTESLAVLPVRLESAPIRSIGLQGDSLRVTLKRADWDAMLADTFGGGGLGVWDLALDMALTFGQIGGQQITLDGYRLRVTNPETFARPYPRETGASDVVAPREITLDLVTTPGLLRGDKGGMVFGDAAGTLSAQGGGRTLNPVGVDNRVDTAHADYHDCRELADLLLDALGISHDPAPASLNVAADGETTLTAPGPLDFGLADAMRELDALMAWTGHAAIWTNDSRHVSIVRLKRAGETITFTSVFTDNLAEAEAPADHLVETKSVRSDRIVVTSAPTKSTIITERGLFQEGVETDYSVSWVAFDEATQKWLDQVAWEALHPPGDIGPDDIDEWNAGPTGTDGDRGRARAWGKRLFRAVALSTAADVGAFGKFVTLTAPYTREFPPGSGAMVELTGRSAVAFGRFSQPGGAADQYVNVPIDDEGDDRERVEIVRAIPGALDAGGTPYGAVFVLEPGNAYVRSLNENDPTFTHGGARALDPVVGDLWVMFTCEAQTGLVEWDFYCTCWNVSVDGGTGVISVAKETDQALVEAALADPAVVKVHQPEMRRVLWMSLANVEAGEDPTPQNDDDLDDDAAQIALRKAGDGMVLQGVVPLRGILNVQPGDLDGAVSSVAWDLGSFRTIVRINGHEVAGTLMQQFARQQGRTPVGSVAAHAATRSSIDAAADRTGTVVGGGTGGGG